MIPLEDNVGDIIGKAQRGLGIADSELAKRAGIARESLIAVRDNGKGDRDTLEKIAPALQLDAAALIDLSEGKWKPDEIKIDEGFGQFTTDYNGMTVNSFLVWDPNSKEAIAFD